MNILIVGATGGTGRELVKQALELGHNVTAFVRNPARMKLTHDRLTIAKGNVLDYESVENAVKGKDAVLSALGHKRWIVPTAILSEGTKNIIRAMDKHAVKRFICETTLGIGDTRGRMGLYYTLFVIPVLLYFYFRDKELQERYIKESDLDWTIVRPGQLTNGRKKGSCRTGEEVGNWILTVTVSRADVAAFMLKQLTDASFARKTVAVAN
jgi:putative NADH-flavin reductase